MRVVLDTSVLWSPYALDAAQREHRAVVLPAVAYTERARQFLARGWSVADLDRVLLQAGIQVEPFAAAHGLRFAAHVQDPQRWRRLARDALIAGHVGPDDELWTQDAEDFLAVGVPEAQLVAV